MYFDEECLGSDEGSQLLNRSSTFTAPLCIMRRLVSSVGCPARSSDVDEAENRRGLVCGCPFLLVVLLAPFRYLYVFRSAASGNAMDVF